MSYGEFRIPAGKHSIVVENVKSFYGEQITVLNYATSTSLIWFARIFTDKASDYSTIFYTVEHYCPDVAHPKAEACTPTAIQHWKDIDVHHGQEVHISKFNYKYPVQLTLVDAGYRSDKVRRCLHCFIVAISD